MTSKTRSHAVGVFPNWAEAERAVEQLRLAGFQDEDIAVVMHHAKNDLVEVTDLDAAKAADVTGQSKAEEGALTGAATGAILGGLMAFLPAMIPGVGPVLTVGTLAAALFGVTAGATGGGIVGALIGADFPEEEARFYEKELKAGKVLVGVKAPGHYEDAVAILSRTGGWGGIPTVPGTGSGVSTTNV